MAFVATFTFAWAVEAAECGPRDKIGAFLGKKWKEVRQSVALTGHQPQPLIAELFVAESGTWTLLVTNPEGISCIYIAGTAWEAVEPIPPFIGPHTY